MVAVTIKAKGVCAPPVASVRLATDPRRTNVNVGPNWKYNLNPGTYAFNVDYEVIAPGSATFAFTNANQIGSTTLTPIGNPTPGTVASGNDDIIFTV